MIEHNIYEIEDKTEAVVASILKQQFKKAIMFQVCHKLSADNNKSELLILFKIREIKNQFAPVSLEDNEEIKPLSAVIIGLHQLGISCSRNDRLDALSLGIKIPNREFDKIANL